jgi:O-antigen/teichoic acid export membrane protein
MDGPASIPHKSTLLAQFARIRRSPFFLNLASLGGATVASRLIGLITLGYTARVMGPEHYGIIGFGASVAAYAGIVISPGLMTWGARELARDRANAGRYLVIVNLTQLVLALLAFSGLIAFAFLALSDPVERTVVILSGLVLLQTALAAEWVLNGLELVRVTAGIGLVSTCISTAGLLLLIRSPEHLYRVPLLSLGVGLLSSCITYAVLLKRLGVRLILPSAREFRTALRASAPLGVTLALVVVLHHANNLIIRAFVGQAELGMYLASYRLLELATTVPALLGTAFLPRLYRSVADSPEASAREARLFAQVHMTLAFPVAAMFLAEAGTIIGMVYGESYLAAVTLLRIMSLAVLFNFAICGYSNCLIAFGRDRVMLAVVVASAVVAIGGGLLAVPVLGATGAAIVVAGVDMAGFLVSLPAYSRTIGALQFGTWTLPALGGGCMVAMSFGLQATPLPVWLRIVLVMSVYLPFAWAGARRILR